MYSQNIENTFSIGEQLLLNYSSCCDIVEFERYYVQFIHVILRTYICSSWRIIWQIIKKQEEKSYRSSPQTYFILPLDFFLTANQRRKYVYVYVSAPTLAKTCGLKLVINTTFPRSGILSLPLVKRPAASRSPQWPLALSLSPQAITHTLSLSFSLREVHTHARGDPVSKRERT